MNHKCLGRLTCSGYHIRAQKLVSEYNLGEFNKDQPSRFSRDTDELRNEHTVVYTGDFY